MKTYSEDNRKHLDYLQALITRMNSNSFQLKSLAITITAAFLAIFASTQKVVFIIISVAPVLIFWFLDAYYLQQERKLRGIYNDVIGYTTVNKIEVYQMPLNLYKGNGYSYIESFFSKTIIPLYLSVIIALIGSSVFLLINNYKLF
ncbi:MAG: hypothetical protein KBB84_08310 [Spirochaetes bacterium]|nr:hypothetical protein [Spirochaetota bacterium]